DPRRPLRARRSGRYRGADPDAEGSRVSDAAPILELDAVTKRFGGLTAVSGVSLRVAAGEILGIIGPNGAGKTTLFNVISGYYRPESRRILFAGHEVTGQPPHPIRPLRPTPAFPPVNS